MLCDWYSVFAEVERRHWTYRRKYVEIDGLKARRFYDNWQGKVFSNASQKQSKGKLMFVIYCDMNVAIRSMSIQKNEMRHKVRNKKKKKKKWKLSIISGGSFFVWLLAKFEEVGLSAFAPVPSIAETHVERDTRSGFCVSLRACMCIRVCSCVARLHVHNIDRRK